MFRKILKMGIAFTALVALGGVCIGTAYWYVSTTSQSVKPLKGCMVTSMNEVSLCPEDDTYVFLNEISEVLKSAILLSEDVSFFDHSGFDWFEIKESFISNIKKFRFFRGGSTLTQQLVKNVFLNKDKTLLRKLREAYLTTQVETMLSKEKILERYLNVVEFGPNIFGVKAAAAHYFHKTPWDLTLLESTYLAHLLPNPKVYSQGYHKGELTEFSKKRILSLCRRLFNFKKISQEEYERARESVDQFPWFVTISDFEVDAVDEGGWE